MPQQPINFNASILTAYVARKSLNQAQTISADSSKTLTARRQFNLHIRATKTNELIYFYDALQAMADWRVRTTTQVLENIAYRSELGCDTVVLSVFSKLLAVAGAGQRMTT